MSKIGDAIRQVYDFAKRQYIRYKMDVYVVSFPKTGRSWLRVLIGKALCERFMLPDDIVLSTYAVTRAAGVSRAQFIHDHSSIQAAYDYRQLPEDKTRFRNKKVIFLVRDIKDTLVSCYFQATRRVGMYEGTISDFIRSRRFGARKIIAFYNIWHRNRKVPREFLLLRYEDIHEDPEKVLVEALRFLGLQEIDSGIVKRAADFASFDNMRRLERRDYFSDSKLKPRDPDDEESYKVRKGVVGGYTAYLSEEDIEYIDQTIEEIGCPFEQMRFDGTSAV